MLEGNPDKRQNAGTDGAEGQRDAEVASASWKLIAGRSSLNSLAGWHIEQRRHLHSVSDATIVFIKAGRRPFTRFISSSPASQKAQETFASSSSSSSSKTKSARLSAPTFARQRAIYPEPLLRPSLRRCLPIHQGRFIPQQENA